MKTTLALFMKIAFVITILVSLYYGLTYQSIQSKHNQNVDKIDQFQIQKK